MLVRSHTPQGCILGLDVRANPVSVDLDTAVTLGLVANELLLNALKHGFDGRPAGKVTVERGNFDVPVVFLTAHADDGTMERAVAAGPFGYVLKPFSGPALKAAIETALHKYQTELESRRGANRAA